MKGLHLRSLTGELHAVEPEHNVKPVLSIQEVDTKLGAWQGYLYERWGDHFSFLNEYHRLPLKALGGFSFDELCKLKYSTDIMMDESVNKLFETCPRHEVVRKITSSMWRWGFTRGTWNGLVATYDNIRNFTFLDDPNFEIRLDHTTYYNECGWSKYKRIFLDGVFAFLVYYKGTHVLTIGFSIPEDNKLLIQQVQSAKRAGNRFLYRLPANRIEFVIELFQKNFPGYCIRVVDGASLAKKTLESYASGVHVLQERCDRYRKELETDKADACIKEWLRTSELEKTELKSKIAQLKADKSRLASFYGNAGRFALGPAANQINGLNHCDVLQ